MKAITYKDETMGAEYVVEEIPADLLDQAKAYREQLLEKVSEADDALLEKYLSGEEITEAEIKAALRLRVNKSVHGRVEAPFVPVICGSAFKNKGVQPLLDAVVDFLPSPIDIPAIQGVSMDKADETPIERPADDTKPFAALVFKIMTDPFVGQLTFIRVYSGVLTSGSSVLNSTKGKTERIGRLLKMHANKREEIKEVYAGDIAACVGLKSVTTGDTICDEKQAGRARVDGLPGAGDLAGHRAEDQERPGEAGPGSGEADGRGPDLPRADRPADRPDHHRGHGRAAPRDHRRPPEARVQRRGQRRPSAGRLQGNHHDAGRGRRPVHAADRWSRPVRPREDPPDSAAARRRLPVREQDRRRHDSEGIHQADRRGHQGSPQTGVLAGFPVDDVGIELYDGSYHDVDSNEMAFKIAGSMAFKDAAKKARPVLLEPVMRVEVVVPEEYMGDIIGDIASRRGHIESQEDLGGTQIVSSRVPLSEMFGYATDLRSRTQGRATYSMHFDRYEQAPGHVAEEVIARMQGTKQ